MPDLDRLWRRLALACAGASFVALPLPAAAYEPMPAAVPTQWGGFYVGGQLGGAWSEADWHYDNANFFNTLGPMLLGRNFSLDADGVIGGGQLGYNYQSGPWVLGVEGSIAASALDASRRSPFFPDLDRYSTDVHWLTTITGRLGYAQGRWLAYAKAGWAGAEVGLNLVDVTTLTRAVGDQWANGWTVGGGGEYAFGGGFSVAVEYGYADLDIEHWRVHCPQCGSASFEATPIVDGDIAVQSVTARLNYRFGR
jgi:outer membrane immunogenic protein